MDKIDILRNTPITLDFDTPIFLSIIPDICKSDIPPTKKQKTTQYQKKPPEIDVFNINFFSSFSNYKYEKDKNIFLDCHAAKNNNISKECCFDDNEFYCKYCKVAFQFKLYEMMLWYVLLLFKKLKIPGKTYNR